MQTNIARAFKYQSPPINVPTTFISLLPKIRKLYKAKTYDTTNAGQI